MPENATSAPPRGMMGIREELRLMSKELLKQFRNTVSHVLPLTALIAAVNTALLSSPRRSWCSY